MKKSILSVFLVLFLFSGCGLFRKVKETQETKKKTEISKETNRDSTSVTEKTAPSESEITLDIKSLAEMVGDFQQRISSGNGTESVIEKRDGKLTIRNNNAGSSDTKTNVNQNEKETIYTSEFIIKETKEVISRLPWWIWLAVIIWLLIVFRKVIAQLLIALFPALAGLRLLKLFVGNNDVK